MATHRAFRAACVLTMTSPPVEDGVVVVQNGTITQCGTWKECAPFIPEGTQVEDLGSVVLLPGLINAHCHLDYTSFAGLIPPPRGFVDWIQAILALKSSFIFSDYASSWLDGARMLLQAGVTTVVDVEAVPELLPDVLPEAAPRVISCQELTGVSGRIPPAEVLADAQLNMERLLDNPSIPRQHAFGLSPHAPYSTVPELLHRSAEYCRAHKLPLTIHVAESAEEFELFSSRSGPFETWLRKQRPLDDCGGTSPVQHLSRYGVLGANCLAVHVNYLAPGDSRLLAESRTTVVHCPRSHDYFGHGRFPIAEFRQAGVPVCIATDSLASVRKPSGRSVAKLDLLEELRMFRSKNPGFDPIDLLSMVTRIPASGIGLAGKAGILAPGSRADLAAIRFSGKPEEAAEAVLAHQGPVAGTMVDGEWIWKGATH